MSFLNSKTTIIIPDAIQDIERRASLPPSLRKKALCMGINDYPGKGSDLRGCVNDAKEWAKLLKHEYRFSVQSLYNYQVTSKRFLEIMGNYIADSKALDHIVGTYSGHGTTEKDRNGDEADRRDEALCFHDRLFIDDELRGLFSSLHPEARLTFISDSCHSGTVTRSFLNTMGMDKAPMPRYMPPEDIEEVYGLFDGSTRSRLLHPEKNMNEVLISGCLPTEYSYDARLGGRFMGAMSYYATNILKENPSLTYDVFYEKLREKLPSQRYPQTPCLEGSAVNRAEKMFM